MYGCTSNLEMYDPGEILRRFGWVEPVYKFVLIVSNSLFLLVNFSTFIFYLFLSTFITFFFFFFFFFSEIGNRTDNYNL
jgi:hypothetical protein